MTKAYHYLYFRTYEIIAKTNKTSAEYSSASFLSLIILINVFSFYFVFFDSSNVIAFCIFCGIAAILSFLNLLYLLNDLKNKSILYEFKDAKIKKIYKMLVDSYPYVSFIILFTVMDTEYSAFYYFIGLIVLIKTVAYFWEL